MLFQKLFTAAVTAALTSVLFVMPVSAHGHHSRQAQTVDTSCPVCTVEDCTEEGRHSHDGHEYCGYNHADGYCDGTCFSGNAVSGCGGKHHH
ncbi:MAG: hypothetical protein J6D08_14660 [Lachnospiraceae bacterium]|nr:hypothetical protein [Lachnospiraceae bacterium]